jgi:phosphomannomutase
MLDDIAARHGSRVIRTPVGEANVVRRCWHNAIIGGEGNGGVIDTRIVPGRDSLVGMAYVLQLMAAPARAQPARGEIPRYEIVKTKFECRREDANRAVEALKKEFADEKVDTQDGIRIDWDRAWVHARPSNTEPIMRIIAEAPDRAEAENAASRRCRRWAVVRTGIRLFLISSTGTLPASSRAKMFAPSAPARSATPRARRRC